MNTAASVDAEATTGVPSLSSIVAVTIGHPVKGQAKQEKASVKATCKPKKPRKLPERRPKEAMLAYRIHLKKKLQETNVEDIKVKELENTNLKELIAKLQKEQAEMIKTVMTMKEDERNVLSTEPVYTRNQVTRLRKQNWSKQKQHTETLQKLTKSIAKADRDIKTRKQGLENWKDYRDKGHLQHKQEITLLQKEMNDMEKYFEEMAAQLELDLFRSREESERVAEEIIQQNQYIATEKAIAKMDHFKRKEVMENYWLRDEIKLQRHGIENLLHETEELAQANLALLNDVTQSHLEDLKISRFTEQFSSVEDLCENSTLETDLVKMSLKKSVVFQVVHVAVQKYLKQGPLESQFLSHHLNIQQSKAPVAEDAKALDNGSDKWPVAWNMLKKFCKNSDRH